MCHAIRYWQDGLEVCQLCKDSVVVTLLKAAGTMLAVVVTILVAWDTRGRIAKAVLKYRMMNKTFGDSFTTADIIMGNDITTGTMSSGKLRNKALRLVIVDAEQEAERSGVYDNLTPQQKKKMSEKRKKEAALMSNKHVGRNARRKSSSTKIKILVSAMQVASAIAAGMGDIPWPRSLKGLLQWVSSVVNIDIGVSLDLSCMMSGLNEYSWFVIYTYVPVLLCIVIFLVCNLKLCGRGSPRSSLQVIVVVLFLMYPSVCRYTKFLPLTYVRTFL